MEMTTIPAEIDSDWILLKEPKPLSDVRLFCFPYAGGGAYLYKSWNNRFPLSIEVCPVQLPGREDRLSTPGFDNVDLLVQTLIQELDHWFDKPIAFFGHCMGAKILFELTRELAKQGVVPLEIFVSACGAPHIPEQFPFYNLSDEEFAKGLERFGGTSDMALGNKEIMDYYVSKLRKDFHLSDTYLSKSKTPVDCPITAFSGTEDPKVLKKEILLWKEYTNHEFNIYDIEGDHFFIKTSVDDILPIVIQRLNQRIPE